MLTEGSRLEFEVVKRYNRLGVVNRMGGVQA